MGIRRRINLIKTSKLNCGITLVTEYIPYVESAAVGIWVGTGSSEEIAKHSGVSHFTEHMMFKGTDKRSAKEIASDIDKLGGQINAFTGKEATCYYVKTTENNLLKAADVLVDMITSSRFDKEEMDRERLVICEEIKMTSDTPDDLAIDEGLHLVLESSSLGNSILGTPSSLKRITSNVMHNYVRDKYTLDRMVVSVAGKFDEEKVRDFFENAFVSMQKKQVYTEKRQGEYKAKYRSIKKDIEQSHICLATKSISLDDDRSFALSILVNSFGGSMSSRLFQNVREQKGLAYSVYATNSSLSSDGVFAIYAGVGQENLTRAVSAIKEELDKLKDGGLTSEELESSREQLKASYIFSQESSLGRMFKNGKDQLILGRTYEQDEIIASFDKVSHDDINEVKKLISDFSNYSMALVSNKRVDVRRLMENRI